MERIQSYTTADRRRERVVFRERSANRVEANGRHTGPGGRGSASDDNVVRLPREWLGPREELVPFAVDDEPVDPLASPPSTHDFWGEADDDLWGKPAEEMAPEPRRRLPRCRGVVHAGESPVRRFLRRSLNRTPPIALPARAQRRDAVAPRRLRLRLRPSAWVAVGVALTMIGVAISAAEQTRHPAPTARASRGRPARTTATVAAGIGFVPPHPASRLRARPSARLQARPSISRVHPVPHRTRSARQTHAATSPRATRHTTPQPQTSTVQPVRYTAPATTTTSASPSAAPPVTTAVTAPVTPAARSSAGSHQPATGASGALAPGSSPDG